ncbi:hypothetical protein [Frondihabitans sp. PhB188]|nr:hypothetical protein [Frondihabitans sp. PhB188]
MRWRAASVARPVGDARGHLVGRLAASGAAPFREVAVVVVSASGG